MCVCVWCVCTRMVMWCACTCMYICVVYIHLCGAHVCFAVHTHVHLCGAHAYLVCAHMCLCGARMHMFVCCVCTHVCLCGTRMHTFVCLCVICVHMSGRLSWAQVCPHVFESVHLPHLAATRGSALGATLPKLQVQGAADGRAGPPARAHPCPRRPGRWVRWRGARAACPRGLCSACVCGACVYLHTHVLRALSFPAGRLHHPCRPRLPAGHCLPLGERAPHPALRGGGPLQLGEVPGRAEAGWFCGLWGWGGAGAGRGQGREGGPGPWEPLPVLLGS